MTKNILLIIGILCVAMWFNSCNKPGASADNEGKKGDQVSSQKVDVDKLDIPDRMKEGVKSGRIPMSRVTEFLQMKKNGTNSPMVEIQPVTRTKINAFLVLNGTVEPERKVEVYSRLAAYVKQIVKEEGDIVQKDDLLALLDDTEISFSYKQAQIQLQQAELSFNDESVNMQRSEELRKTEMISQQDFQTAQSNFNKAKLELQTKKENFKDLQLQLNYTRITAPVSGYVTERLFEVGTRVTAGQKVFTVEDFSPLLVKVFVPTSDIINLKKGMTAELSTDVLSGMVFTGKIKLINPRIDVQSGTVKVTVEVFDPTLKLKPGMFVETKILIRNNPNARVIPRKSVSYNQDNAFVFVFKKGTVSKRVIETGISEGEMIEVTSGLDDTDKIVTVGVESLKDNMTVQVKGFGGRPDGAAPREQRTKQ